MTKKLEIKIVADTNDADWVTEITEITEKDLAKVMPLIEAIKKSKAEHGHNYNTRWEDYEDDDDINEAVDCVKKQYPKISSKIHDLFYDHCPRPANGFHTIESIVVYPIPKKKVLLAWKW